MRRQSCLHVGNSQSGVRGCVLSQCCGCVRSLSSVELCDVLSSSSLLWPSEPGKKWGVFTLVRSASLGDCLVSTGLRRCFCGPGWACVGPPRQPCTHPERGVVMPPPLLLRVAMRVEMGNRVALWNPSHLRFACELETTFQWMVR